MRTVEDASGRRYLLLKRSGESSLVRDAESGEERHVPNEALVEREGIDPLEAAASAVPAPVRRLLSAVHDDRGVGLVVELAREPRSARALLDATDLCESDLVGQLSELRAAGLVEETTVDGERGYAATEVAKLAVEALTADAEPLTGVGETADGEGQSAEAPSSETSE